MGLQEEIGKVFTAISAEMTESRGLYTAEYVVAERKSFLSKKKLLYVAKYRVDEEKREVRFTEMLKETGSGISAGDTETGFGFKKETYKTGGGGREGMIEEQASLFGKKYSYAFDYKAIRGAVEKKAREAGLAFEFIALRNRWRGCYCTPGWEVLTCVQEVMSHEEQHPTT